ncbi:threonine synthase [Rhodohalobacter sulfatireducens]|uniref:Threonine synthase n=1 Tax=Rhodohalobacter sulfatireducens TaxID=2911366 RepID=A0ABS9KAT3_9BACT|nr:threonine synthase [Rhodohalobacter sulfatireducens]MCG2587945.1 threonine synthase [Rhodohalobacter sulfatireducens]
MKFISTNKNSNPVTFLEAMRKGLAPDGGLYMPEEIPVLPDSFWSSLKELSFNEIAFEMAKPYFGEELSDEKLNSVINDAFNFPVPITPVEGNNFVLELFHGPTLAFKDFGARFMARLFSEQARKDQQEVTILVATSGDTGSAVAHGFYKVDGVKVCLLFPKGKVSNLQEQQMATLGENVTALEVEGVFDDCQRLVKQAFIDDELNSKMQLSSANSINIARLLPQSFYYAYAVSVLQKKGIEMPVFSVPSGNFGNLTGGLLAMKMGMPAKHFLAATNVNDVVPEYLKGDQFQPRDSVQTISNAMDVGNPSNFVRIKYLFGDSDSAIRDQITGYSYTDEETRETIREVFEKFSYLLCPHTAIGYRASKEYQTERGMKIPTVTLATAHPVKFRDVIETEINQEIDVPDRLKVWLEKEKKSTTIGCDFEGFKEFLINRA